MGILTIPFDPRVRTNPMRAGKPSWGVAVLDTKVMPFFLCACGKRGAISEHDIADDGTVTPSVHHEDCGFHEHIVLDSWPGWESLNQESGMMN